MTIIIPLGGSGQRFKLSSPLPKGLIPVLGKGILFWLMDLLSLDGEEVIMPYNTEYIAHDIESILQKRYPNTKFYFIPLLEQTRGAAETLRIGIEKYFENNNDDGPIISIDGDNFYLDKVLDLWNKGNKLIVFEDTGPNPIFSYVKLDERNCISEIKEKDKISDYANCGAYGFESIKKLHYYCCKIINGRNYLLYM